MRTPQVPAPWSQHGATELDNIRDESGELPAFAWPGSYPILYLDKDNSTLCPSCANDNDEDVFPLVGHFIHWEGPAIYCDECNEPQESAYGDPNAEEGE